MSRLFSDCTAIKVSFSSARKGDGNDRDGFSRFRRCYMTRVTAASALRRFPCSNNVALTGVYVPALLSPVISTFNDRENGKSAGQKWLRASAPRKMYRYHPSLRPPFFFFFSFFLFFLLHDKPQNLSRAAVVTWFPGVISPDRAKIKRIRRK